MSRWFRFYDETINDPKALKLSDKTFRIWVGLLCLASKNGGILPSFEDMCISLRIKPKALQPELEKLIAAILLDHGDHGIEPHNWNTRQYKSDVSTERVKRFRNGKRNVSETPPETDSETDKREWGERASGSLISSEAFEITRAIADSHGSDRENPEWCGFPHTAQSWLNEKIPKDFILATCARLPGKHQNYLDKAVRNGWRDRLTEPQQTPRKPNGSAKNSGLAAIDRVFENFEQRRSEALAGPDENVVLSLPARSIS